VNISDSFYVHSQTQSNIGYNKLLQFLSIVAPYCFVFLFVFFFSTTTILSLYQH